MFVPLMIILLIAGITGCNLNNHNDHTSRHDNYTNHQLTAHQLIEINKRLAELNEILRHHDYHKP